MKPRTIYWLAGRYRPGRVLSATLCLIVGICGCQSFGPKSPARLQGPFGNGDQDSVADQQGVFNAAVQGVTGLDLSKTVQAPPPAAHADQAGADPELVTENKAHPPAAPPRADLQGLVNAAVQGVTGVSLSKTVHASMSAGLLVLLLFDKFFSHRREMRRIEQRRDQEIKSCG